jgi:hypothetical protein
MAEPTLLVYNSVTGLLAGDLGHTVTVPEVEADLTPFPSEWPVVGVGTTDWRGRNGEMMPDGTAGALHFWWADPDSPSHAALHDDADPGYVARLHHAVRIPFLALAIADPATALTWPLEPTDDVAGWLRARLAAAGIELAGLRLRGEFGLTKTTDSYNLPTTGFDLCGGYVGEDHFRFVDYEQGGWVMNGLYAAEPALAGLIAVPNDPLHLHGYQPGAMVGGHVGRAVARSGTATLWPLQAVVRRQAPLTPPS